MMTKNASLKLSLSENVLDFFRRRNISTPNSNFISLFVESEFLNTPNDRGIFCQNDGCIVCHVDKFIYYAQVSQYDKSSHFEFNPEFYLTPDTEKFYPSDISFADKIEDFELCFSHEEDDPSGGKTIIAEYENENDFKLLIEFGAGLGFLGGVVLEFDGIDVSEEVDLNIEDFAWEALSTFSV